MSRFWDLTLGGISSGAIFAAVALSLVLIWRATRVVNFAQGGMAMVTTFVAYEVISRTGSYWLGFGVALVSGLVLGAVVERTLIRPVERKPPLNAVIVTLGLLVLLEALAGMVWGVTPRSFPYAFDLRGTFSPSDAFAVLSVAGAALLLLLLFQATATGLRMRAAAFEPEVARLLGVRVGRVLTLGWALAAVAGSLAGMLAGPPFISPTGMDALLVFGFTAAVIGGLESPAGAVLGGLVLGLVLSYVSGYVGADMVAFGALVILVAVLMVRPNGVFGRSGTRRV